MIRLAAHEDLVNAELLAMGRTFFMEANLPGKFIPESFSRNWRAILEKDLGCVWLYLHEGQIVGAIGGLIYPDINDDVPVVQEMFWFIQPEFRKGLGAIKLFNQLQHWSSARGAKRLYMGNACNQHMAKVGKFLEGLGFRPAGVSYVIDL